MSVYPNQYKTFPTHKNQIDTVDGEDINAIQDEVESIQKVLGRVPTRYVGNESAITDYSTQAGYSGLASGGLEDNITGTLVNYAQTDRNIRAEVKDYATLADRLDDIQRGKSWHCFKLKANSIDVPQTGIAIDNRPRGIYFPRPSGTNNDPFSMHNGVGVTIKRSGFWVFEGHAVYNLQSNNPENNKGVYNLAIDIDGEWLDGMSRVGHTQNNWLVILQTTRMTFVDRGARITLRTSQNSTPTQKIRLATLAGHIIREND
jgi:hypothetical protein